MWGRKSSSFLIRPYAVVSNFIAGLVLKCIISFFSEWGMHANSWKVIHASRALWSIPWSVSNPYQCFQIRLWPIKGILYAITRFRMTSQVYNSVARGKGLGEKRFEAIDHGHLISLCRFPKVYSLFSPLSLQKLIKQNSIPPLYSSSCWFVPQGFHHLPLITASPRAISWTDVDFVSYPCLSAGWLIHLSIFQWWLCWHSFFLAYFPLLCGVAQIYLYYPSMYHLPGYIFASLHSAWRKNK